MPNLQVPRILKPLLRPKKFKAIYSGRGAGKSMTVAGILLMRVQTERIFVSAMREHMNSIEDSVHSLFASEIERLELEGFEVLGNSIRHKDGGEIRYKGLSRNPEAVKSMHGFSVFWVEEAATLSKRSLDLLIPTLRSEGAELWMTFNPGSSSDPVSKEFIVPYQAQLDRDRYYEDETTMVIRSNYKNNPFFPKNLEQLRQKHHEHKPRAEYDHVWNGEFNDSVDSALIKAEWYDACIDAHKKLGFRATGARFAAHDPSDMGGDAKGYCLRHGSVVLDVQQKLTGDVNAGCDWAVGLAKQGGCDYFSWDCDGLGAALNRQVAEAFKGTRTQVRQFKGSESPDAPTQIYEPIEDGGIIGAKKNEDVFRNKRAQYYCILRDRMYRTYRAVVSGSYEDPDKMISISSDIDCLQQLRSEVCRLPVKPNLNGKVQLYTKAEMLSRYQIPSPNLSDSLMMSLLPAANIITKQAMPRPIRVMGARGPRYGV